MPTVSVKMEQSEQETGLSCRCGKGLRLWAVETVDGEASHVYATSRVSALAAIVYGKGLHDYIERCVVHLGNGNFEQQEQRHQGHCIEPDAG